MPNTYIDFVDNLLAEGLNESALSALYTLTGLNTFPERQASKLTKAQHMSLVSAQDQFS